MSTTSHLKEREETLLCRTYSRYPLSVVRGKGSRLWDAEGKEYIDLLAGIAVTSLGHCNAELADTIAASAQKLIHVSNLFYQEEQLDYAERLLGTCRFDKVFFCNSGAEANEAVIKMARRYMQKVRGEDRFEIITLQGAFHGRTLATVAATGQAKFQDGFSPMPAGFKQVPFGDAEALKKAISPKTAAVLAEIIQGEGGVRPMQAEYAKAVQGICKEANILFMVDEVQTGLCRTGETWAHQLFDLEPDVMSSAKALANGLPLGAMLVTNEVAKGFVAGSHATTFGGGALLTACANKVLEIMQRDNLAARAKTLGEKLRHNIAAINTRVEGSIKEVRGHGLMVGAQLNLDAEKSKAVWNALLTRGYICSLTQETTLRLLPALNIPEADLDSFVKTLEEVLIAHNS